MCVLSGDFCEMPGIQHICCTVEYPLVKPGWWSTVHAAAPALLRPIACVIAKQM